MAVHNGAQYLLPQIQSILDQLDASDELIVVNDASRDASGLLLASLSDPRVCVLDNEENRGVVATFERALRCAQRETVFLSDQDDIWLPGKVAKILDVLESDLTATLVVSDAVVIDGNGAIVTRSFFEKRGAFVAGVIPNLIKNKYLGCTLAFRRSMLDYFLPIPKKVPMHDMWFGILNDIYGKTVYVDVPLVAYRRHGRNASPDRAAALMQRVTWRWRLSTELLRRTLRIWYQRSKTH